MNYDAALLRTIDRLVAVPPQTPDQLSESISVPVPPGHREIDLVGRFKSGEITYSRVEFRHSPMAIAPIVMLVLSEGCLARTAVLSHYEGLEITRFPHSGYPDEVFSYSRWESWGQLSFSFKQSNLECLSSIVLDYIARPGAPWPN